MAGAGTDGAGPLTAASNGTQISNLTATAVAGLSRVAANATQAILASAVEAANATSPGQQEDGVVGLPLVVSNISSADTAAHVVAAAQAPPPLSLTYFSLDPAPDLPSPHESAPAALSAPPATLARPSPSVQFDPPAPPFFFLTSTPFVPIPPYQVEQHFDPNIRSHHGNPMFNHRHRHLPKDPTPVTTLLTFYAILVSCP